MELTPACHAARAVRYSSIARPAPVALTACPVKCMIGANSPDVRASSCATARQTIALARTHAHAAFAIANSRARAHLAHNQRPIAARDQLALWLHARLFGHYKPRGIRTQLALVGLHAAAVNAQCAARCGSRSRREAKSDERGGKPVKGRRCGAASALRLYFRTGVRRPGAPASMSLSTGLIPLGGASASRRKSTPSLATGLVPLSGGVPASAAPSGASATGGGGFDEEFEKMLNAGGDSPTASASTRRKKKRGSSKAKVRARGAAQAALRRLTALRALWRAEAVQQRQQRRRLTACCGAMPLMSQRGVQRQLTHLCAPQKRKPRASRPKALELDGQQALSAHCVTAPDCHTLPQRRRRQRCASEVQAEVGHAHLCPRHAAHSERMAWQASAQTKSQVGALAAYRQQAHAAYRARRPRPPLVRGCARRLPAR